MSRKGSGSSNAGFQHSVAPSGLGAPASSRLNLSFLHFSIALIVLSAIAAAFINFPPGDSWTQGWIVQQWLHGHFIFNDWASTLALPQQILGWVINLGSSDVIWSRLSILTAIVTVLGCLISAMLPSMLFPQWPRLKDWAPLLAIVAIAPTFTMEIAAGFMTDGYYLFFLAWSLFILLKILNEKEHSDSLWIGRWIGFGVLATLAATQRTHGVVLLAVVAIWLFFARIRSNADPKWAGWRGWFAVGMCALGLIVSFAILLNPAFKTARAGEVQSEIIHFWLLRSIGPGELLKDRFTLLFGIFQHFGFALLPIALIARLDRSSIERQSGKQTGSWWYVIFGAIFIMLTLGLYAAQHALFPYIGNSLTPEGFGDRADTIALTASHTMSQALRLTLTVIGTIGGMVLIWILSRTVKFRGIDWRAPSTLIGLLGIAHLGLVLLNPNFFDRYLVPLIPFAFCWLAPILKDAPPKARTIGWAIVVVALVWSVAGTVDSLSWTKAKWDLALETRAKGISENQICAGYEADGFYSYQVGTPRPLWPRGKFGSPPWWVEKLALPILPKYVIVEKGAKSSGTFWDGYAPTGISNDRMEVLETNGQIPFDVPIPIK